MAMDYYFIGPISELLEVMRGVGEVGRKVHRTERCKKGKEKAHYSECWYRYAKSSTYIMVLRSLKFVKTPFLCGLYLTDYKGKSLCLLSL